MQHLNLTQDRIKPLTMFGMLFTFFFRTRYPAYRCLMSGSPAISQEKKAASRKKGIILPQESSAGSPSAGKSPGSR